MARGTLTVQDITVAGTTPSYSAGSADGHQFANDGKTFVQVKNTGAGACTVTIQAPTKVGGLSLTAPTVVVPITSGDKQIGPFDPTLFNQVGGLVYVDLSATSGVTLGAFRLP